MICVLSYRIMRSWQCVQYFEIPWMNWTYLGVQGVWEYSETCNGHKCILHFVTIHELLLFSWRSLRRHEQHGRNGRSSWRNVLRRTLKESPTWKRTGWMLRLSAKLSTSNSQTLRTSLKLWTRNTAKPRNCSRNTSKSKHGSPLFNRDICEGKGFQRFCGISIMLSYRESDFVKREEELKKILEEKESCYKAQLEILQKRVRIDTVCWGTEVPPEPLLSTIFSPNLIFFFLVGRGSGVLYQASGPYSRKLQWRVYGFRQ